MDPNKTITMIGGEIKATGDGKIAGPLVVFTGPDDPDRSYYRDYFTKSTDYDFEEGDKVSLYYHHSLDKKVGATKFGKVALSLRDDCVWAAGAVKSGNDELDAEMLQRIEKGELKFSSGATTHLVRRQRVGKTHEVKMWPISEASMTPKPAREDAHIYAIKSCDGSEFEEPVEAKTLPELLADSEDEYIRDAAKALPTLDKYIFTSAARSALTRLSESALYLVGDLMSPDFQQYDSSTQTYIKPSKEDRMEAIRKILSDFAQLSYAVVASLSSSAESLQTKSLNDLTDSLPGGLPFADHSNKVLDTAVEVVERAQALAVLRCGEGKPWNEGALKTLDDLSSGLAKAGADAKALADAHRPKDETMDDEIEALEIEFMEQENRLQALLPAA